MVARAGLVFILDQGASVDETVFLILFGLGWVETGEVHLGWEEIDEEEANNCSDDGNEGRERKFWTENANYAAEHHKKNVEDLKSFLSGLFVEDFDEPSPGDVDHDGEGTNSAQQIGYFHEENGPVC